MATAHVKYLGGLRTEATHLRSGNKLITDAPVDNQGKGEAFSPTDLLATAYASCILSITGMAAQTHGFDITGAEITVTKIMGTNPRRIVELNMEIVLPHDDYSPKHKKMIEQVVKTCPVYNSLNPEIKKEIKFTYRNQPVVN